MSIYCYSFLVLRLKSLVFRFVALRFRYWIGYGRNDWRRSEDRMVIDGILWSRCEGRKGLLMDELRLKDRLRLNEGRRRGETKMSRIRFHDLHRSNTTSRKRRRFIGCKHFRRRSLSLHLFPRPRVLHLLMSNSIDDVLHATTKHMFILFQLIDNWNNYLLWSTLR